MKNRAMLFVLAAMAGLVALPAAWADVQVGAMVYGNNGRHLLVGQVRNILDDRAEVEWSRMDGQSIALRSTWHLSRLSPAVETYASDTGDFSPGSRVYGTYYGTTASGQEMDWPAVGRVERVFENGMIEVQWMRRGGVQRPLRPTVRHYTHLSVAVPCLGSICEQSVVTGRSSTGADLVGRVIRVFSDGTVEVRWCRSGGRVVDFGRPFYWHAANLHALAGDVGLR